MPISARIHEFIDPLIQWASSQSAIKAVALVGSYARGTASTTSDVDLMIITDDPLRYIEDTNWLHTFGIVLRDQREEYGLVTSIRTWYDNGFEVEFGLTSSAWLNDPLDEGTVQILKDGFHVLFEREPLFSSLPNSLNSSGINR